MIQYVPAEQGWEALTCWLGKIEQVVVPGPSAKQVVESLKIAAV